MAISPPGIFLNYNNFYIYLFAVDIVVVVNNSQRTTHYSLRMPGKP